MSQIPPPDDEIPKPVPAPLVLPYSTPPTAASINLRKIAACQRTINICMLVNIIGLILAMYVGRRNSFITLPLLLILASSVVATAYLSMMAFRLYGLIAAIGIGIYSLIPILGLIPLLLVNREATYILRRNDIKVGLLGANPSSIPLDLAPLSNLLTLKKL